MDLITSIRQTFQRVKKPSLRELQWAIQSLELTAEQVQPFIQNPTYLPYGRTIMFKSEEVEAVLIHLPGKAETAIHDHGDSIGCGIVLEGELENAIYRLDAYCYPIEAASFVVGTNEFFTAPKGQVHQMRNAREERLITFHVYTPALAGAVNYLPYEQVLDFVI
ncbi:cysteine dioxygenase [Paenibacillus hamazuiensis]|uniref:cysteine dioxygenase n=1 Tax=Paenibacillus hamazuiensis TaxID=2936508 RepID=UPI00200C69F0|nr:cysteine dioxygenase family protein [Paenibacillus hamazuiensis]